MKKILVLFLSLAMMLSLLAGCGNTNEIEKNNQQTNNSSSNSSTDSSEQSEVSQDLQTDIVIIGAGGAGLSAAISAHDAGAKVIILEKMPMVGGNTLRATGGMNAAATKYQQENGIEDSVELFIEDTIKGGYEKNDPELVRVFAENSSSSIDWLVDLGADLSDVGRMGGHTVNRTHRPTGGAAVGAHIVQVLKKATEERNIDILLNNTATEILTSSDNKITGVKAKDKDGNEYTIEASSVIIATGGFGANPDKVSQYKSELKDFGTTNHPGASGDAIDLVANLDVQLIDMIEIQTHPTVVPEKGIMITEAVRGNGAILVNHTGNRFVDELSTRDVVSKATLEQDGKTAYLIFDQTVRESLSAIEKYIKMGLVTEATTIEELEEKMNIESTNLKNTLEKYNTAVSSSNDSEFGRSSMKFELKTGPFYAVEVAPAVHHTMGGIKINTSAQVLNNSNEPIQGLFAAGEVAGGIHGGNRLGGNALTDIITFGRIAGESAAK